MHFVRLSTAIAAGLLVAAGCADSRSTDGLQESVLTCTDCHGDAARSTTGADPLVTAAPPRAASGIATDPTIGAHLVHLTDGPLSRALACSSCHAVPTSFDTHSRTSPIAFSGLATAAWAGAPAISPAYSRGSTALTCASTYCHGAFRNGIAANLPDWTGGPSQAACGTCHGLPPTTQAQAGTHPNTGADGCGRCHTGFTGTTVDVALHVNGAVDLAPLTCTSCHGDPLRSGSDAAAQALAPAPPTDASGSATGEAVGAHLRHLTPRASKPVACAECHQGLIPTAMDHANGVRDVAFGALSRAVLGVGTPPAPAWDGATAGCSATYCHGSFRNGLGAGPVAWNGPPAGCTSCHGFPPKTAAEGGTHSANTRCGTCHAVDGNSLPVKATHVDGKVDLLPMSP